MTTRWAERQPQANDQLFGHADAEQLLLTAYNADRLPHGWLFAGSAGIGKATLAFRFARFLLAQNQNNNSSFGLFADAPKAEPAIVANLHIPLTHPAAQRIAAGSQPDLLVIDRPEAGKAITVDEVRKIMPFLTMTALENGWRIVIIDGADNMNRAAQNALLKILEEPTPNSLIMLLAENAGSLLPTIRSRCRLLRMDADQTAHSETILAEELPELSPQGRAVLLNMAGDALGRALQLSRSGALDILAQLDGYARAPSRAAADNLARAFTNDALYPTAVQSLLWLLSYLAIVCGQGEQPLIFTNYTVNLPQLLALYDSAAQQFRDADALYLDKAQLLRQILWQLPKAIMPVK